MDAVCDQPISLDSSQGEGPQLKPPSMTSYDLAPGSILDGRFEITELICRSGMASIFKARDLKSGAAVALKVTLMECESDHLAFARVLRDTTPSLSSVRVPLVDIVIAAIGLALAAPSDEPRLMHVDGTVVLRDSTPSLGPEPGQTNTQ